MHLKSRLGGYNVDEKLGGGGFGLTYLATDSSGNKCVLKELLQDSHSSSEDERRMFQEEAKRLEEVGHHDQIPSFIEYFETEGKLYIAQQYISGDNLEQALKEGRYSEEDAIASLKSLLPVVGYLHENGIIHRDIKPANVIRQNDGTLVLVDFGASKRLTATVMNKTGTSIGSIGYNSFEQLKGHADKPSDIYSLGMTVIHLLTGSHPKDYVDDPMDGSPQWTLELGGNAVSQKLESVLTKMVNLFPAKRYQTAAEVLEALGNTSFTIGSNFQFTGQLNSADVPACLTSLTLAKNDPDESMPRMDLGALKRFAQSKGFVLDERSVFDEGNTGPPYGVLKNRRDEVNKILPKIKKPGRGKMDLFSRDRRQIIGKNLRLRRLSLRLSQEAVAESAMIKSYQLMMIEKGSKAIELEETQRVCDVLNVSIIDMAEYEAILDFDDSPIAKELREELDQEIELASNIGVAKRFGIVTRNAWSNLSEIRNFIRDWRQGKLNPLDSEP